MELARQCWDESRHVAVLHRRLSEMGGHKGEFPISTFEWTVTCALDDLAGRLASQNRTFEAGAMDVVAGTRRRRCARSATRRRPRSSTGSWPTRSSTCASPTAGSRPAWSEDRRVLLKVAMAVRFLAEANVALAGRRPARRTPWARVIGRPSERVPAVNVEDRKLAEFTDEEVHEILRQAGFRSLVPSRRRGAAVSAPARSACSSPTARRATPASTVKDAGRRWRTSRRTIPRHALEFLHRQMNEEVNGLEISARNLADFPDADWELRLAMARQCWDEARHVVMFRRCFERARRPGRASTRC